MNNAIYTDVKTPHRVRYNGKLRCVYARQDWEGNFIRFVVHLTKAEVLARQKKYLPAQVGVANWFEVYEHNFSVD